MAAVYYYALSCYIGGSLRSQKQGNCGDIFRLGCWQPGAEYYKYEKGLIRPDGQPGFNTTTGLVELYSNMYENFGDNPLPYYRKPPFSYIESPQWAEEYPLILTTGSRRMS